MMSLSSGRVIGNRFRHVFVITDVFDMRVPELV
jgi:hypothetical protein